MIESTEAALLRAIAEADEDNLPRLVYADWLDERGDAARAEFIRVQCELASAPESETRSLTLRVRERELLTAHRREWCSGFGVPLEDVVFERGFVASVRLKEWDRGGFLDPAIAPRFATLTELDLSELQLQDSDVTAFAESARLPGLRKLVLSENLITDAGASRFAKAFGLPRLDTLYIFGNSISILGFIDLTSSSRFRLVRLDSGERTEGYSMSRGQTEIARRKYLRTRLLPFVEGYFRKYERLQSAMLCVAQYWNDEADDAVHGRLILSELFEPNLLGAEYRYGSDDESAKPDPNVPNTKITGEHGATGSVVSIWSEGWDANFTAIPLWAGFSPEGGSQNHDEPSDAYAPAARFYRHGGYELLPMIRPQLDGVRPEMDEND